MTKQEQQELRDDLDFMIRRRKLEDDGYVNLLSIEKMEYLLSLLPDGEANEQRGEKSTMVLDYICPKHGYVHPNKVWKDERGDRCPCGEYLKFEGEQGTINASQSYYGILFAHMAEEHDLILLDNEMEEIVQIVKSLHIDPTNDANSDLENQNLSGKLYGIIEGRYLEWDEGKIDDFPKAAVKDIKNTITSVLSHHQKQWEERERELVNEKNNLAKCTAQKIGNQLVGLCNEHIKTDGLRFFGLPWADVQRTLEKYGYQHEEPF